MQLSIFGHGSFNSFILLEFIFFFSAVHHLLPQAKWYSYFWPFSFKQNKYSVFYIKRCLIGNRKHLKVEKKSTNAFYFSSYLEISSFITFHFIWRYFYQLQNFLNEVPNPNFSRKKIPISVTTSMDDKLLITLQIGHLSQMDNRQIHLSQRLCLLVFILHQITSKT